MKRRGWYNDSFRHSLAAKGVKSTYLAEKKKTIAGSFARSLLKGARGSKGRGNLIIGKGVAAEAREKRRDLTPKELERQREININLLQKQKERNIRGLEDAKYVRGFDGEMVSVFDFYRTLGISKNDFLSAQNRGPQSMIPVVESANVNNFNEKERKFIIKKLEKLSKLYRSLRSDGRARIVEALKKKFEWSVDSKNRGEAFDVRKAFISRKSETETETGTESEADLKEDISISSDENATILDDILDELGKVEND